MFKKTLATAAIALSLVSQPVKADTDDAALAAFGGLFAGIIINQAMQPRVYMHTAPSYAYPPTTYYVPPPVYYRPPPVCQYESWYDQWGYLHSQRICY